MDIPDKSLMFAWAELLLSVQLMCAKLSTAVKKIRELNDHWNNQLPKAKVLYLKL